MSGNLLAQEASPYLLQHKDNPVHWMPWGRAALDRARAEGKPILLSVGYAACHWCHVMAHESFEDEETAALMNRLFVNVKVDREERPDIDHIYQSALAMLGEQGGWPLTMFLTAEGDPFWGGTYFPKEARYGRPGFKAVLQTISDAHAEGSDKVSRNATALRQALRQLAEPAAGETVEPALLDRIAERLHREIDPIHGGIGGAPKFPQPGILMLLWRHWLRSGNQDSRDYVLLTLERMCQGGIYDHLGGGFARYSTDAQWLAPHFEKMLYDNAQLIEMLTHAALETGRPLFRQRLEETIGWVLREMVTEEGGFASSLDADSEGEEGKFYVWREAEIDDVLSDLSDEAREAFKRAYDVTPQGNWEGATILHRSRRPDLGNGAAESQLAQIRHILFEHRQQRERPGWDDKVLADWNGLMIRALAQASFAFAHADWLRAAIRGFDYVVEKMILNGRLRHSRRGNILRHPATLEDYANMASAALALFQITRHQRFLDQSILWVEVLDRHYWDADSGGYFATADDTDDVVLRAKNAQDNAVPSGNGTMLQVLTSLYHLTGDEKHRRKADILIPRFAGEVGRNFFPLATFLNACDIAQRPLQITLTGDPATPTYVGLLRAIAEISAPGLILHQLGQKGSLPANHPASMALEATAQSAAYLCVGQRCSLPLHDPKALSEALLAARSER
ncbi:MAG: thioredoxin domain-containing protein [Oceanibaculum sp.]